MYGVDLYRRVRLACHRDELSRRKAARRFGIDRKTVAKILAHSVPPGYEPAELAAYFGVSVPLIGAIVREAGFEKPHLSARGMSAILP